MRLTGTAFISKLLSLTKIEHFSILGIKHETGKEICEVVKRRDSLRQLRSCPRTVPGKEILHIEIIRNFFGKLNFE